MDQVSLADEQAPLDQGGKADPRPSGSYLGVGAAVAIGMIASLLLFYGFAYPLHHDLAGSLLSGRLAVVLGDSYREYSIYFPPAERIWFSIAARLSDWIGVRLDLAGVGMIAAMVLFSAGLAYRIRRTAVGASWLFFAASVGLLVLLPILFKNVFGLREHLVALGLWPYMILRLSDPDGTRIGIGTRLVVGLWAGATMLIKYLYSVVVILVEVSDALVQRRPALLFRVENVVAGAVVALYLFLWLGLDLSQREAIGAMFSAIDAALVDARFNWIKLGQQLGFAIGFVVVLYGFKVPLRCLALAFASIVGAAIVAWSQERWFTHHLFPIFLAYVLWWWATRKFWPWWGHAAFALCLSYPLIYQFQETSEYRRDVRVVHQAISGSGHSVSGKKVGVLTMHPSPYNQYLAWQNAARWNALMNIAYVSTELKPLDTKEKAGKPTPPITLADPGRRLIHDQMLRLWEDHPPDVLIFDYSYSWPLRHIEVRWEDVFSNDPRFGAILSHYRPVLTFSEKRVKFTYYVRTN